jgi:hypothetical protein
MSQVGAWGASSPRSFYSKKKLPGVKPSLTVVIDFPAASFVNDFDSQTAKFGVICSLVTYCLNILKCNLCTNRFDIKEIQNFDEKLSYHIVTCMSDYRRRLGW